MLAQICYEVRAPSTALHCPLQFSLLWQTPTNRTVLKGTTPEWGLTNVFWLNGVTECKNCFWKLVCLYF